MTQPTDIENYFFRFRLHSVPNAEYYHYSCGYGAGGLYIGHRFLSVTESDATVSDCSIEYVAAFPIATWDFDDQSLPAEPESYTWLFLAETDMITGEWQPYGQAMADGAAGFDILQPIVAPMQNHSDDHVRNVTLGYTPLVTGWTVWNI